MNRDLEKRFEEAVVIASEMTQASLPQDVQLRLYAFYKQATVGTPSLNYNLGLDLRSAFKTNAWLQIQNFTADEAKAAYTELIHEIIEKRKNEK